MGLVLPLDVITEVRMCSYFATGVVCLLTMVDAADSEKKEKKLKRTDDIRPTFFSRVGGLTNRRCWCQLLAMVADVCA